MLNTQEPPLSIASVRLDKLQTEILHALYERSERWHVLPQLGRIVFPGAAAYRDAELAGFLMPRLRRMRALDFVKLRRLGADLVATISLKGIEFIENYSLTRQPATA
jgi:hypothetical protein